MPKPRKNKKTSPDSPGQQMAEHLMRIAAAYIDLADQLLIQLPPGAMPGLTANRQYALEVLKVLAGTEDLAAAAIAKVHDTLG